MTSSSPQIEDSLREVIISQPHVILDDKDLMKALIIASEREMGENIIDLRGIAMDRLESRLDRLEDTHRSVIAAAYENLAGTNQIHRAVLRMLEPTEFADFLRDLNGEVIDILRVDASKLVLETAHTDEAASLKGFDHVLSVVQPGFIDSYVSSNRGGPSRQVTLRQIKEASGLLYGEKAPSIRSEACMKLDFGQGCLPGLFVMGSTDPQMFAPQQGTDLLAFFAGILERCMRRWLS